MDPDSSRKVRKKIENLLASRSRLICSCHAALGFVGWILKPLSTALPPEGVPSQQHSCAARDDMRGQMAYVVKGQVRDLHVIEVMEDPGIKLAEGADRAPAAGPGSGRRSQEAR